MAEFLCISATFLDSRYHGRSDGGDAEWPPSPLRLFQAMIAANADQLSVASDLTEALQWLEAQSPPVMIAPRVRQGARYRLSVPNNSMDVVARSWSRGNYFGGGDASPATHRAMKTIAPQYLVDDDTVAYLWSLDTSNRPEERLLVALKSAARRLIALGWGIDLVVGNAAIINADLLSNFCGEMWRPTSLSTSNSLRVPIAGTLSSLQSRYEAFLQRIGEDGFRPRDAFSQFRQVAYQNASEMPPVPSMAFELLHDDGSWCAYAQRKLIHLAGMVRHLAIGCMQTVSPLDVSGDWVERYVAGHAAKDEVNHRQFSYLPLPSIGHRYGDHLIRRILIAAPPGDQRLLEHLTNRLNGERLIPEKGNEFGAEGAPRLVKIPGDSVTRCYTKASSVWHSVTPIILPGHDDHKPAKTRRLIERALANSGITHPCEYDWSTHSRFRKSYSAHKYDRNKRETGYLRPDHLMSQTAVHLTLRFKECEPSGPISLGSGRHCGFGLMANATP